MSGIRGREVGEGAALRRIRHLSTVICWIAALVVCPLAFSQDDQCPSRPRPPQVGRAIRGTVAFGHIRLAHVSVRITGAGGDTTTDSGEFCIYLPATMGDGDKIEFYIEGFNITDLPDGRVAYVPRNHTEFIKL